ncbi:MAG: PAS domain-containing sensor histidine kinase [Spongiibacter marinus]|uniref:sensor histidine kinase n=1 Tax=Spongiibacter TaxID=630749 RepID=UPI000C093B80|nr:PAS domain-containing hybrid sensor histidine kinase/response regulator [Spongiibacter sp.]MAK44927.1 hypothetical protein [Spongiibacter sp.]
MRASTTARRYVVRRCAFRLVWSALLATSLAVGSARAEITGFIERPVPFAETLAEVDYLLDHGAVVPRFFDLLENSDLAAFQALQQQMSRAQSPLATLQSLGGEQQALLSLQSIVSAYSAYKVGNAAAVPLNAELDQRIVIDALSKLHDQLVAQIARDEKRWQSAQRNRLLLLFSLVVMVSAAVVLAVLLSRRQRTVSALQANVETEVLRRQTLMASIPGAVLICDAQGVLIAASETASKLLGYRNAALIKRSLRSLFAPRFEHKYEFLMESSSDQDASFKGIELMLMSHSGSEVAVELYPGWYTDADGSRRLLLLIRDMSDQYLMHEQYQHSQQRFDLAVMASHDAIWDWDLLAKEVYLSPAWLQMVGLSRCDERDGLRVLMNSIPEADQQRLNPEFIAFLKSDDKLFSGEHKIRRRDGSVLEVSFQAAVQRDSEGRVVRMVGVQSDISAAKQAERQLLADKHGLEDRLRLQSMQLEEASQRAEQASNAKSAFLSVMGHEFRTPMNAVVGMTDLLSKSALNREQRLMLDTIRRSSQSLLATLDNIIDYSLLETGDVTLEEENVQLWDYLEGVALAVAPMVARNQQQFLLRIDPRLPEQLFTDPIRLRQLLLVLLENAVKFSVYSTPRGIIELQVRPASDVERQYYDWAELVFEVHDNGVGIPEQGSRELFRPFVQAENSRNRRFGGVGLGLAVAEKLVSLMRGHILVSSVDDAGSCFSVLLPAQQLELNHADVDAAGLSIIALVSDERLRLSLSAALSRRGWRVHFVTDVHGLQKHLAKIPDASPQLVISERREACLEALDTVIYLRERPEREESLPAASERVVLTNPLLPSQLYRAIDAAIPSEQDPDTAAGLRP